MGNKQINKFLLMFFLSFTLFFSVSNAFEINETIPNSSLNFDPEYTLIDNFNSSYSLEDSLPILINYVTGADSTGAFNTFINSVLSSNNEDKYCIYTYYNAGKNLYYGRLYTWNSNNSDIATFGTKLGLQSNNVFHYANFTYGNSTSIYNRIMPSTENKVYYFTNYDWSGGRIFFETNSDIKEMTNIDGLYGWAGTYFYKTTIEPIEPEDPNEHQGPTADTVANIHSILMNNSDLSKRFSDNERYFIVYTAISDSYDVYFYPDVDLVARYFSVDENYKFVSYSNSDTGYIELSQKDMWHDFNSMTWYENLASILNPNSYWKYQLFRKYPHQTSFAYKWEVDGCNVWETPGGLTLDLSTSKIVYTSHDIGNMIVEQDGEEYIGSIVEDNSIKKPILINSETGEEYVLDSVPESSVEDVGFWENLINTIIDKIFNLADVLLTVFGANVVTLIFAIAIKTITVLVSSIALIFRFISFIMTLVAIPASSALLAVDVASNSSGLVFTGLNWGTYFINGLNFIKSVQWNGLGLWTLFEVFVASLEVVLFVKIVRKHYRTL